MRWLRTASAWVCAMLITVSAFAQQQTDDFVPVDPSEHGIENLPAAPMVMTAYAIVWLVLIGYVWSLRRRQARVELEIAALRARLNQETPEGTRR